MSVAVVPRCHPDCPQTLADSIVLSEGWRSVTYPVTGRTRFRGAPRNGLMTEAVAEWYRMEAPAGWRMPNVPPGSLHCGNDEAGWVSHDGAHPVAGGKPSESVVCFQNSTDVCAATIAIRICACEYDSALVMTYKLPDVASPSRNYCATGADLSPPPLPPQSPPPSMPFCPPPYPP
eukprot:CAMPEP_0181200858 /NCGR_PEP_ID=MMETSP1096-20121128/17999_1 /TAXON_ID=156174 ORGANISM="Chrysochromulina ericina, Strain CCMP281" /NCGR_SAMPLE_ID=MMETSP1096 /ASSEMBLY_ACC=CAM_ASM_000453 /LENGTH=175 /DNA_ID=CAMNT_0023291265 /DNA_START=80 /DNA_END=604 /DNA_ORIENTATION=+